MSEVLGKIWARLSRRSRRQETTPLPGKEVARLMPVGANADRLFNREVSDLLFIERVMEESANLNHPLFERVRFLAIAADVLEQFYAVRVAKLRRSAARKDGYVTPDGLTPAQQLMIVTNKANDLMQTQESAWLELQQELSTHEITFLSKEELDETDLDWMERYFRSHFLHVLTPFTIDEEHPFPFIQSGGLCAILELEGGYILLPLPANLRRFVKLEGEGHRFVSAEMLIELFWQDLLPEEELRNFGVFQILRDNDLAREERSDDLRSIVESGLRSRHKANVIRLKVSAGMSEAARKFVTEQLGLLSHQEIAFLESRNEPITSSEFIMSAGLVGLSDVSEILDDLGAQYPGFVFPPFKARYPRPLQRFENDCFSAIQNQDILAHWPYESFDSVVRFLDQAAKDPQVIAIKQTLYRTNNESPIVEALITAAQAGKTVLAVVELEARDNEQSNIEIAKQMEAAGVQIVYGIIGLKIHCKASLVVRMEDDEAVTYTHLGTGNYHPRNARTYTDISFFTRDPVIGYDTHLVFNYLTSEKVQPPQKLAVAPFFLREKLFELVDAEIANARAGKPAHICIKVNSLTDPRMIDRFYEASEAGVEIDLIVRRHCCLRPGVPGLSSRIRVKSIVGRFLEHSRIYMFANGAPLGADAAHVYFGSADLMERNLDERAEILVPVEKPQVRRLIVNGIMNANLKDSRQSWLLDGDNNYSRDSADADFCAQTFFMEQEDPTILGDLSQHLQEVANEKK